MNQPTSQNLKNDPNIGYSTAVPYQQTQEVSYPTVGVLPPMAPLQGISSSQVNVHQVQPIVAPVKVVSQTPLLSDYQSSTLDYEQTAKKEDLVPAKKRPSGCARFCRMCCCCCCVSFAVLCVCLCCLTVVGGVISGIVTGAMYAACVNDRTEVHKVYTLNATYTDLVFHQYGDFEIVASDSDEYTVDLTVYLQGNAALNADINPMTHTATFGLSGWTVFGHICQGFKAVVTVPNDLLSTISLEIKNHYGRVKIEEVSQLKKLTVEEHYGKFSLNSISLLEELSLVMRYTDFESSSVTVVSGDVIYDSKYGKGDMKTWSIEAGDFSSTTRYHDLEIDNFNVTGDISIDQRYDHTDINCQGGNFQDLTIVGDYGDVEIENCAVIGVNPVFKLTTSYQDVTIKDISRLGNWIKFDLDHLEYSALKFSNVDYLEFDGDEDNIRYSDVTFKLKPSNFGTYEITFDLEGTYTDWKANDRTSKGDYIDSHISDNKMTGTINEGGVSGPTITAGGIRYSDFEIILED